MKNERPVYVLTLRAEPGAVPETVRLRRLLKALLRGWGFRCVEVREVPAGDAVSGDERQGAADAPAVPQAGHHHPEPGP